MDLYMSGKVLFIAYHYPPIAVSSGVHRTLAFSRYLSDWGWDVTVLTTDYKVYQRYNLDLIGSIPEKVQVIRSWAKDTARDLSIKGRYSQLMALPDRYQSWILGGVWSGLKAIKKNKPDVIVSTYPIASAHVIGYFLHKMTGVPWIADFRDPMAQEGYPEHPLVHKSFLWIERKIVKHASKLVFNTRGAQDYYLQRYAELTPQNSVVIPNGYDEEVFEKVESEIKPTKVREPASPLVLLHSGVIYPSERDPKDLFKAISDLKKDKRINAENFVLRLRASGHDDLFQAQVDALGIQDVVEFAPSISYNDALQEMYAVDVLLLLQADNCELQIPAKAYEYIRVRKPVLALTTTTGETGRLLSAHPLATLAPLNDSQEIYKAIQATIENQSVADNFTDRDVDKYSRRAGAQLMQDAIESCIK
ncbi:MAG: hypothetical protein CSB48_05560 [Proteobacteria bacterium]|nr:MAG: hypothetical protein CSB48_05560 [Pseudomonadota bacterium]